jgi:hypothetical protein
MSLASGVATAADDLRKSQTVFYNETAKNQIPSWGIFQGAEVPKDILKAVKTFDPYNNSMEINQPNMRGYFRSPVDDEGIKMMTDRCKNREQAGWQSLIDGNKPREQCGYVYKGPPTEYSPFAEYKGSVANLFNRPPPNFDMPAGAQYFTNMTAARKQVEKDMCGALRTCEAVGAAPFAGICGFAVDMAKGIPINGTNARYTEDGLFAPAATIITNPAKCPKPDPNNPSATTAVNNSDVPFFTNESCYNTLPKEGEENGLLKRECLLAQVRNAGCKPDGSLYRSLMEGDNGNFASSLEGKKAYQEFQRRAMLANKPIISDQLIKTGFGTIQSALNNFNGLYMSAVDTSQKTAMNAAARDLCLMAGEYDKYDICQDLDDSSPSATIPLQCFQKTFRMAGGTPAGRSYPTLQNISRIQQQYPRWSDYRQSLNDNISELDASQFDTKKKGFKDVWGTNIAQGGPTALNYAPVEGFRNHREEFQATFGREGFANHKAVGLSQGKAEGFAKRKEGFINPTCQMSEEQCSARSTDPKKGSTGRDIAAIPMLSLEACKKACCDNKQCRYYTHVDNYMCFLKDGTCPSEPQSCRVTAGTKG